MLFLKPSLTILKQYYTDPAQNLKLVLSHELDKTIADEGRQSVTRTVYGVVRYQNQLEYIIRQFSDRKLKKIQPDVLLLLKIGTYLLLYSGSTPDYAVVNEVVGISRPNSRGFMNAILRNIALQKSSIINSIRETGSLEIMYSISPFLVDRLGPVSPDISEDLLYLNKEPVFHIRVNPNTISFDDAARMLEDNGIAYTPLHRFHSFEIKDTHRVLHRLVEQNYVYIQNTGSQSISILASKLAQSRVLDSCSAPGTKAITLALMNPLLTIFANDINPKRAPMIRQAILRNHLPGIKPLVSDILYPALKPGKGIDFIILDAPCTSSGTLRKNPDLKLKIDAAMAIKNAEIQYEMIRSVMAHFDCCRYILYSVCSFLSEETEEVMKRIDLQTPQARRCDFQSSLLTQMLDEYGFRYKQGEYGCYLLPNDELNNDLFYISLLALKPLH